MKQICTKLFFLLMPALLIGQGAFADDKPAAVAGGIGVAAIVNDQIITTLDVQDRIQLMLGTTGIADSPETRKRMLPQVARMLVDEALQLQEGARNSLTVDEDEIRGAISMLEKRSNKPEGSLEAMLASRGVPKRSFYNQLKAQVMWNKLMLKTVRKRVRISDEEARRAAAGMKAAGAAGGQVQIATILLPVDAPGNEASVKLLAEKLVGEMRTGVSFESVAAQFASGSTGQATEAFWVDTTQMDPQLARTVSNMQPGTVSDAVRMPNGYQIVKLSGRRQAAVIPEQGGMQKQAEMALKQIMLTLKPDAEVKEANVMIGIAREVAKHPGSCMEKTIAGIENPADLDIKVSFVRNVLSQFSPELRAVVEPLRVGQVSEPFATADGIEVFMLCERIDLPDIEVTASGGSLEEARQKLFGEKMELEAQKYLRNLRRDAYIEVRM